MKKYFTKIRHMILFQLGFRAMGLVFFVSLAFSAETQHKVLLISSYHPGFPTFFEQIDGVKSALEGRSVLLDVEFMDTKRFNELENWDNFYHMLAYKLDKTGPYDVVMAADDNALRFVLDNRDGLLGKTPIVFFGVNNIKLAEQQTKNPRVTGVVEAVSMEETLALMFSLYPKARRAVALVDGTSSGQGDLKTFYALKRRFGSKDFHEISLADHSFEEFLEQVKTLDEQDVVLLLSAYRDKNQKTLLFNESLQLILSNLSRPLFHLWYHGLGDGIIGGKVISHFYQGKTAAEMVCRILDGTPVGGIDVSRISPNQYIFDYRVVKHYGLKLSDFPSGSVFIGKPESFYSTNKVYVWLTAIIFGCLSLVVVVMAMYILQRSRAMNALRESEEKFASFVNQAGDAIFVCDFQGRITYVSQHAVDVMGYSREELLRCNVSDLDGTYHSAESIKPLFETLLVQSPITFETIHRRKNGSTFPVELRAGLLTLGGNPYVLGLARDISERKNAEQEKQQLEFQLRQAAKMESLGTLAGGIAHDFNNILGIILGNTELALDDVAENNSIRENLEEISKASLRAKDIVRQLLHFSRKTDPSRKPIHIIPVIQEAVRLLSATTPANIQIEQDISAMVDIVIADPTQIHQLMVNLIVNAAHSMEDEGGLIVVSITNRLVDEGEALTSVLTAGPCITIRIRDTGHGIDPTIVDRIFDPYFTTKEVGKGSGLGLAIVHGIVKSFGGCLSVKSSPGEGTVFEISLPLSDQEVSSENNGLLVCPGGHEQILFVDDEPAIVVLGQKMLEGLGYDVVATINSEDALKHISSQSDRFDLVITDMAMPRLTGDKLLSAIKKIRPDLPVIICTGFSEKMTEEKAKASGASGFLYKPVRKYDLAVTVRQVLDQKPQEVPDK